MLNWIKQFNIFCYLDNCEYQFQPQTYECLAAVGVASYVSAEAHSLQHLDAFINTKSKWKFGHLSYELKNNLHGLSSSHQSKISFPLFYFFIPKVVCYIKGDTLTIEADDPGAIYNSICISKESVEAEVTNISLQQKLSKEEYIKRIHLLQQHILRGDCYEINFCQEFFADNALIDPAHIFQRLIEVSPNPFSAFYRLQDQYVMCASPERFLNKTGGQLLSQPMKGTARRIQNATIEDEKIKKGLYHNRKERAENVMVVDLVRNDLSIICKKASVQVNELFGIYTFPQVHQMVSTISGVLKEEVSFSQILRATFPMGSMTGAPKSTVIKLIDDYEPSMRGIFSGSVGYINSEGNFDFNVVIRSIMYNQTKKYLSYLVGSGITFYSEAEKEWEECLLKGEAIKKVLRP